MTATCLQPVEQPSTYEHHLAHLHAALDRLFIGHAEHQTNVPCITPPRPGRRVNGRRTCKVDDCCDALNNETTALIDLEFSAAAVADHLLAGVADLGDVRFDEPAWTVLEACVAAYRAVATDRLFPAGAHRPVDPATTRPRIVARPSNVRQLTGATP